MGDKMYSSMHSSPQYKVEASSELYALRKELWVCAGQEAGWAGVETVENKKDPAPDGNPSLLPRSSNLSTLTWILWLC